MSTPSKDQYNIAFYNRSMTIELFMLGSLLFITKYFWDNQNVVEQKSLLFSGISLIVIFITILLSRIIVSIETKMLKNNIPISQLSEEKWEESKQLKLLQILHNLRYLCFIGSFVCTIIAIITEIFRKLC